MHLQSVIRKRPELCGVVLIGAMLIGGCPSPDSAQSQSTGNGTTSLPSAALVYPADAPTTASKSAEIQNALDTVGFYYIPPGLHFIDTPLILRAHNRLEGAGMSSALRYTGPGDYAIQMGETDVYIYGAYLADFTLNLGGLHVVNMAQTCTVERVWVSGAPADGVLIDGQGERLVLRDTIAWENAGAGFALRMTGGTNGVVFDHCNAQNNGLQGVVIDAIGASAEIRNIIFRDCTIQNNATAPGINSEVLVRGLARMTHFENLWIENSRGLRCGIRTESITVGSEVIHPGRLSISGSSVINLVPNAVEFDACYDCRIEQLDMSVGTTIRWRQFSPVGALWLVDFVDIQPMP